jgi:hypothetical protein
VSWMRWEELNAVRPDCMHRPGISSLIDYLSGFRV